MSLSISSSSSLASIVPTGTSPLALTTPFVPPPGCADNFDTTSIVSSFWWNDYSRTTIRVLASGPADSRFTTCQPSGRKGVAPESRFAFSPAVCPSGWTAYELRASETVISVPSLRTLSNAYCCSSGFSLQWPISELSIQSILSPACFRDPGATTSTAAPASTSASSTAWPKTLFPGGTMQVHNAWHVSWAASDASTLSPTPPALTCSMSLATWVPGEVVPPSECHDAYNSGVRIGPSLFYFLVIGIPLIVVIPVAACCCFCIYRRRRGAGYRLVDLTASDIQLRVTSGCGGKEK